MFKQLKHSKTILLGLTLLMLLTAFGCKQDEEESSTNSSDADGNTEVSEQVTYNSAATENKANDSEENANDQETSSNEETTDNSSNDSGASEESNNEDVSDDEKVLLSQAEKLAEIFGTYTNKDKEPFKNLKDLKQYATEKLQGWIDEKSSLSVDKNAAFYGVTTKALSSTFLEKGTSNRKVIITVKKEEITATSNTPKVSYKVILMLFKKAGEDWKLDGIYWQE